MPREEPGTESGAEYNSGLWMNTQVSIAQEMLEVDCEPVNITVSLQFEQRCNSGG